MLLRGEFPIKLARQCRSGEIIWGSQVQDYAHPDNLDELVGLAQRTGAWLHPRLAELPHT